MSKQIAQMAMMIGGALMGFVGLFVTALSSIPTYAIVSLRGLFATIFLYLFLFSTKNLNLLFRLYKIVPFHLITQALLTVTTVLFYFYSIQTIGYAYAAFLLLLGPTFAVIFNWIFYHIHIASRELSAFFIALIGISFLTGLWIPNNPINYNNNQIWGIIGGIGSGISSGLVSSIKTGLYVKIRNDISQSPSNNELLDQKPIFTNLSITIYATFALFGMFFLPSIEYYSLLSWNQWFIAIGLGLLPTAIAFTCVNYGLQFDEGGDVLIFSYTEPIVSTILTAFLQTGLTIELIFGGSLILIANLLIIFKSKNK